VFTLLFGAVLLRRTAIAGNQIVGVILTVTGIVMLTGN
jgi:drug/metabolite transporter (DMT)-like permease